MSKFKTYDQRPRARLNSCQKHIGANLCNEYAVGRYCEKHSEAVATRDMSAISNKYDPYSYKGAGITLKPVLERIDA